MVTESHRENHFNQHFLLHCSNSCDLKNNNLIVRTCSGVLYSSTGEVCLTCFVAHQTTCYLINDTLLAAHFLPHEPVISFHMDGKCSLHAVFALAAPRCWTVNTIMITHDLWGSPWEFASCCNENIKKCWNIKLWGLAGEFETSKKL